MNPARIANAILCMALLAGTFAAQARYRIAGQVVDANSGQPVSGARIQLTPSNSDSAQAGSRTIMSGAAGSFEFADLPAGKFRLFALKRGYLGEYYLAHGAFHSAIVVSTDEDTEHIRFPLHPAAIISGAVRDEFGEPVHNAEVMLFRTGDDTGRIRTAHMRSTQTNDLGEYRFRLLPAGRYYVTVQGRPWFAENRPNPPPQPAPQPTRSEGARSFLFRPPDQASNPLLDVAFPLTFYPGVTSSDGAEELRLESGAEVRADINLRAVPAVHLRINLPRAEQGNAQPGAVRGANGPRLERIAFGLPIGGGNQSTGNTEYVEMFGLAPGEYRLRLGLPNGSSFDRDIPLTGDTVIDSDSGVMPASVSGTLQPSSGTPSPPSVILRNDATRENFSMPFDSQGKFSMKLAPGTYTLLVPGAGLPAITIKGQLLPGRKIKLASSQDVELRISMIQGTGSVDGRAVRNGKAVPAALVLLVPADNPDYFPRDQSDSDGSFSIRSVVPGAYTLIAIEKGWELEWARPEMLASYLTHGKRIEVTPGATTRADAEVQ